MTRIAWDQVGERRYETGLDRGVLYLADNSGVPWNGLTSVDEPLDDVAVSSYYIDGLKYLDKRSVSDFSASVKALTYPDEFEQFDGYAEYSDGLWVSDQPVSEMFGLSYRTKIGNDEDGIDHGYKIHICYNLTSKPDDKSYVSIANAMTPTLFSWTVTGVPVLVSGVRPTAHFIADSTKIPDYSLAALEDSLYGTDSTTPVLLSPDELVDILRTASPSEGISEFIMEPI